jgi:hypothetical protein
LYISIIFLKFELAAFPIFLFHNIPFSTRNAARHGKCCFFFNFDGMLPNTNSFYYFYSAVPQVLGALLALFGVFVIFKVSDLKNQMIGICMTIKDEAESYTFKDGSFLKLNEEMDNSTIFKSLTRYMERIDLVGLKRTLELINNQHFGIPLIRYSDLFSVRKKLIFWTIILSIYTSIIILFCLVCLTLGEKILSCPELLRMLFIITLVLIFICFSGLIYVLIKSIVEKDYSTIPN